MDRANRSSTTRIPQQLNDPFLNVTRRLLQMHKEALYAMPTGEPISYHLVKDIDFYRPFSADAAAGKLEKPGLPQVVLGFPNGVKPDGCYIDNSQYALDNGGATDPKLTHGYTRSPSRQLDLSYRLRLLSDHTMRFQSLLSAWTHAADAFEAGLSYFDPEIGEARCYDLDVTLWPQADSATPNADGLFAADAALVVRGVEFTSGRLERHPLITSYQVLGVRIGQEVTVNSENDLTLTGG